MFLSGRAGGDGLCALLNAWNQFYAALIYMTDADRFTLSLLPAGARTNPGRFG